MRGGVNNETLVTLDGFALYEPFHLKLLLSPTSLLDPGILSTVDVHAGGFTADFGDRMNSVIEATSIHPEADQHYELGLSLFNASLVAFNRFADGAGQWLVAARRSNLDEIADLVDAPYGELSYSDAFGRLDYAFSPDTRGSLHVLLSTDDANVTNSQRTESSAADYRNTYAWATLVHDFSPQLQRERHRFVHVRFDRADGRGGRGWHPRRAPSTMSGTTTSSACSSAQATRPSAG